MSLSDEELNDSALFCKSLIQKRKASSSISQKNPKQLKLSALFKTAENKEMKGKSNNSEENENMKGEGCFSGYFKTRERLNTCPLCLKSFKSDSAYSGHMKQCAKTHKMTTHQLLEALELQKKQMQERRDLGLCTQNIPTVKKPTLKKKDDNERDSYDLALGLAISNSLSSCDAKTQVLVEKLEVVENNIPPDQVPAVCKKKNEDGKKFTLRERTAEERQRIIIEKVALILIDGEQELQSDNKKTTSNSCKSDQLINLVNKGEKLWNYGQSDEKRDWYVNEIKMLVIEEEINNEEKEETISTENLESEISKLNLPQVEIHKSWKNVINCDKFSDLVVRTKDSQVFYFHSIVIFARFRDVLEKDYESIFEKYNLSTISIFSEYLYCGTLNNLVRNELKELCNLALDFNYIELINILNCLERNLSKERKSINNFSKLGNEDKGGFEDENKNEELFEKDLFGEDNLENFSQKSQEEKSEKNDSDSENESNVEKSYWSFMHKGKKLEVELNDNQKENVETSDEEICDTMQQEKEVEGELGRRQSEDSATGELGDEFKINNSRRNSDCIILSSGSESHDSKKKLEKSRLDHSRTPSPNNVEYEIPYYDPYDNFHCFSEEQFSPVAIHSQSLITGDISSDSLKLPEVQKTPKELCTVVEEEKESRKSSTYCSTPLTIRRSLKIKSSKKGSLERSRKRRRSDLSANRIVRKSLGLQFKAKNKSSRKSIKRKESFKEKDLAEVLTDSILNELSKSATVKSSTPVRKKNFVEITPISNREELGEAVTPSPNYSNMEETLLKEHLSKYGLKKNLGKKKAKKILRHIYEELHPLYNTETGKIVKMLPTETPKSKKKSKGRPKANGTNAKSKQSKNEKVKKTKEKERNDSGTMSDDSSGTLKGPSDDDSDESEFENLNETLTQTVPSNPLDLPSAFIEYLENNPEYHLKILSYEPIWLEELQKKLKESFKKHFKIADLMDFLDQKVLKFLKLQTEIPNLKGNLRQIMFSVHHFPICSASQKHSKKERKKKRNSEKKKHSLEFHHRVKSIESINWLYQEK